MNNTFLARYEQDLVDKNTQQVSKNIARNLKDCLSDEEIAERTGLSLEEVQQL